MNLNSIFNKKKNTLTWHETIKDGIEKLEAGDLSALRIVYSAFATQDSRLIRRAGEAIRLHMGSMTQTQLFRLCERFRTFTSLEWGIDWADIHLEPIKKMLPADTWRFVLILGSFHPSGYFREACIRDMEDRKGMLVWLFPRVNDWVLPVRETACRILEAQLPGCGEEELFTCLPAYEQLQNCGRRTKHQMQMLEEHLTAGLSQALGKMEPEKILCLAPAVRASLYRSAAQARLFDLPKMETCLALEKQSCLKRLLIRRIFAHPDCTPEWAERFLTDRSSLIRRMAVEFRYEHLKDCWPGLEQMLLDKSRGVREYAAYILERRSSLDIRAFYLDHLGNDPSWTAILGLSEYSHSGNVPRLMEFLRHPERRIIKCALLALGTQEDFTDESLLWHYVLDESVDLSKAAYLSMRKRDFHPSAAKIHAALSRARTEHHRRYLLNLLLLENYWERLPYLLLLYRPELPEQERILSGIRRRSMYRKISGPLREQILLALEQTEDVLPAEIAEEILYAMRFV